MAIRPAAKSSWFVILLMVAAAVLWVVDLKRGSASADWQKNDRATSAGHGEGKPDRTPTVPKKPAKPSTRGSYEFYQGCTLVEEGGNDGDSFKVRLPDGRSEVFRLYFVDTPESRFRRYAGGDTNHERIRQQASDMGGITPEQAVEIGAKGKSLTLSLLKRSPFALYTCWDSPYQDQRYHAFVEVAGESGKRWLHEILVERGLARIKTKPADLPDGTPASAHRDHLRVLEREAKRRKSGAWGI
jgi:endonuclease YncB( thermonuclease family)